MVSSIVRKLPAASEHCGADGNVSSESDDDDDYVDGDARKTYVAGATSHRTQSESIFVVPVANMLPSSVTLGRASTGQSMGRQSMRENSGSTNGLAEREDHDNGTPRQSRAIKRRDFSTKSPHAKRQKQTARKSLLCGTFDLSEDDADDPYPSPLLLHSATTHQPVGQQQIDIPDEDEDTAVVGDEDDSVQGTLDVEDLWRRSSSRANARPRRHSRLIVHIKVAARSQVLESLQMRLASKIIDIHRVGLQRPNTMLLVSTVELLEKIWDMDSARLFKVYGSALGDYRGVKVRWTECVKALAKFCELSGSKGNENSVKDTLDSIDDDFPEAAIQCYHHMRGEISTWRCEEGWSDVNFVEDAASVLFHSASWHPKMMSSEKMQSLNRGFSQELLSWCTQV
jgi:hypothetical protein